MATATTHRPRSSRAAGYARAALVFVLVIVIDQVTKHTVASGIQPGQVEHVIPGVKLVYVRNPGVAFGFLSGGGTIVLVVTLVALAGLVCYFALRPQRRLLWLPTGLLLGGAIGNLIDRVNDGVVTDFIKLPHWPAFNVADMAITFGVLTLLYALEIGSRRDGGQAADE
jgi:signal peptidase II